MPTKDNGRTIRRGVCYCKYRPRRLATQAEMFQSGMRLLHRLFPALLFLMCLVALQALDVAPKTKDPWPASALLEPQQFVKMISNSASTKPVIIYVGFPALYNGAHITDSILAGPASKPEALDQLRQVVKLLPRSKQIAIYCGCCPFDHCPNIRPAYSYLRNMGFQNIVVVHLPTNLHTDWVAKGYPTTKSGSE